MKNKRLSLRKTPLYSFFSAFALASALSVPIAQGSGPDDDHDAQILDEEGNPVVLHRPPDPSAPLAALDAATAGVVSSGPSAKVIKNLALAGRGVRNVANATTDVWAHDGYAYTGTFNNPCGGDPEAGVWIWDVHNKNEPSFVGIIESPVGSRSNDVRVDTMNSGDILVHSNESCGGGPGGFEIYNVDDPDKPVHLASVQTDDVNAFLRDVFGFVDFGVHNLWLFTQGGNDYVAATVESEFGNFQIFDITDPTNPSLVGFWGAEQIDASKSAFPAPHPSEDYATLSDFDKILDTDAYLFDGFGASQNRFLHDVTISADGTKAYLANWDAGLVLLDISDPSSPHLVSVALDPVNGSLDGEVNSHSVWPSEDGTIVVEGEEDFSVFEGDTPFLGSLQNLNTIPGVGASTNTGNALEASPTGNAGTLTADSLAVDSGPLAVSTFDVLEMVNNNVPLGAGSVSGDLVWIGRACNGDPLANPVSPGDIAIARRGECFFSEKAANAAAAGAAAIVIANNQENSVWSGLRIWDYSDPANPVLASTFDTVCSANPSDPSCDPAGTYSVHNVLVETTGNKVKAYVSWYSDGMLILDVSDPANPVETARFLDDSTNDGEPNDFWGVDKETNSPWIYGSDRNGGLYIFKELGSGSAKKGNNNQGSAEVSTTAAGASESGFVHGIVINVDGVDYWLAGAPDGPAGATDIPGHDWVQAGPRQVVGKHYNTGPFGAPQWWSSDAPDGELLYLVHGVIDTWTAQQAERYAARGYVHYHELVSVADGSLHPSKVVWLRHHARTSFTLDGGPRPDPAHAVRPGIDFEFINNYFVPYAP